MFSSFRTSFLSTCRSWRLCARFLCRYFRWFVWLYFFPFQSWSLCLFQFAYVCEFSELQHVHDMQCTPFLLLESSNIFYYLPFSSSCFLISFPPSKCKEGQMQYTNFSKKENTFHSFSDLSWKTFGSLEDAPKALQIQKTVGILGNALELLSESLCTDALSCYDHLMVWAYVYVCSMQSAGQGREEMVSNVFLPNNQLHMHIYDSINIDMPLLICEFENISNPYVCVHTHLNILSMPQLAGKTFSVWVYKGIKHPILIEEDLVCGSFLLVLKVD